MGNRRSDEPTKTKKGLSIFLDAARWNRGEPQGEVPGLCPPRLPHTAPASWSHLSFQPPISDTSKSRLMVMVLKLAGGLGEGVGAAPGPWGGWGWSTDCCGLEELGSHFPLLPGCLPS